DLKILLGATPSGRLQGSPSNPSSSSNLNSSRHQHLSQPGPISTRSSRASMPWEKLFGNLRNSTCRPCRLC
ncbi:hypothetical protein DXG03_009669, partial [Asterophora parasitica]